MYSNSEITKLQLCVRRTKRLFYASHMFAINQQRQVIKFTFSDFNSHTNVVIHARSFNVLCSGNAVLFVKPLISECWKYSKMWIYTTVFPSVERGSRASIFIFQNLLKSIYIVVKVGEVMRFLPLSFQIILNFGNNFRRFFCYLTFFLFFH